LSYQGNELTSTPLQSIRPGGPDGCNGPCGYNNLQLPADLHSQAGLHHLLNSGPARDPFVNADLPDNKSPRLAASSEILCCLPSEMSSCGPNELEFYEISCECGAQHEVSVQDSRFVALRWHGRSECQKSLLCTLNSFSDRSTVVEQIGFINEIRASQPHLCHSARSKLHSLVRKHYCSLNGGMFKEQAAIHRSGTFGPFAHLRDLEGKVTGTLQCQEDHKEHLIIENYMQVEATTYEDIRCQCGSTYSVEVGATGLPRFINYNQTLLGVSGCVMSLLCVLTGMTDQYQREWAIAHLSNGVVCL